jgi:L-lactate utilization protein LutC
MICPLVWPERAADVALLAAETAATTAAAALLIEPRSRRRRSASLVPTSVICVLPTPADSRRFQQRLRCRELRASVVTLAAALQPAAI